MAEYIERTALGVGKCDPDVFEDKGYAKGWNAAIDIIWNAPAADVQPVRHGWWMETGDFSDEQIDWVACDRCKAKIPDFDYSYCPNCGALMDKEMDTDGI